MIFDVAAINCNNFGLLVIKLQRTTATAAVDRENYEPSWQYCNQTRASNTQVYHSYVLRLLQFHCYLLAAIQTHSLYLYYVSGSPTYICVYTYMYVIYYVLVCIRTAETCLKTIRTLCIIVQSVEQIVVSLRQLRY